MKVLIAFLTLDEKKEITVVGKIDAVEVEDSDDESDEEDLTIIARSQSPCGTLNIMEPTNLVAVTPDIVVVEVEVEVETMEGREIGEQHQGGVSRVQVAQTPTLGVTELQLG